LRILRDPEGNLGSNDNRTAAVCSPSSFRASFVSLKPMERGKATNLDGKSRVHGAG
jgi:hypothetical protein